MEVVRLGVMAHMSVRALMTHDVERACLGHFHGSYCNPRKERGPASLTLDEKVNHIQSKPLSIVKVNSPRNLSSQDNLSSQVERVR